MFYYISFLRPPPVQAAPYGTLTIKPQISNDLRTESFQGEQELYYAWVRCGGQQGRPLSNISKPQKLTTWRPSSAYKDIPVPLPEGVRDGQYWRLVLMGERQVRGRASPECVDLSWVPSSGGSAGSSSTFGQGPPFPVMSMPIFFLGKNHKGALKQESVERSYLVPVRCDDKAWKASLRFVERVSFDLDKKIWDSGIGLSSWLVELKENESMRAENAMKTLYDSLFSAEPRRILELGTGIGFVSAIIASLRPVNVKGQSEGDGEEGLTAAQSHSQFQSNAECDCILATDVESAMPLIEHNLSLNSAHFQRTQPRALVLDWDDEELPREVRELGGLDVIVMADVTYNTASFPSLCRTLSTLTKRTPANEPPPTILLGYKQRDECEREFWGMMTACGIEFDKIGERVGTGEDAPVEIWSGRVV